MIRNSYLPGAQLSNNPNTQAFHTNNIEPQPPRIQIITKQYLKVVPLTD